VAWQLVLGARASPAGAWSAPGVHAKAGERRWWREEFACGHDVMLDMPNELAALLLQHT
jgi:hypothetical protein